MSPFQGRWRLFTNLDFYGILNTLSFEANSIANVHRCKGHRADIWRRPGAKHCSSLCSQSEGGEYCGGQALKIQQSHAPERWPCSLRVRGPHFASKVSYNASPHPPPQKACNLSLQSPHRFPNKPKKSSIRGRKQCCQRPRVARTAAASSTTRGRKSITCK